MYKNIRPTTLAYTGGLIDGEGSICLEVAYPSGRFRRPSIAVGNTSIELLTFLKLTFGGYISKRNICLAGHKQSWTWRIADTRAIELCRVLLPYLKEKEKIRRARLIGNIYPKVTSRNGRYSPGLRLKKLAFEKAFME